METTNARVKSRLLAKADRPVAGTQRGRIIEFLQHARRAGASKVVINNKDGMVTVQHDGREVEDFAQLLQLGDSTSADPKSGEAQTEIGLSSFAPRRLKIRSGGRFVIIEEDDWTGTPINVHDDPERCPGTVLEFSDEPWTRFAVEPHAVFSGVDVVVDEEKCAKRPFVTEDAADHPELGCRIEVRANGNSNRLWLSARDEGQHTVFVNFHGRVVSFAYRPVSVHPLTILVDLTDEPKGIQMMPGGTELAKNTALKQLKQAIEIEAFRFLERRGCHRLPYRESYRARTLGIDLPEVTPMREVGLLATEFQTSPAHIDEPEDRVMGSRYRLNRTRAGDGVSMAANAHLLAALGTLKRPFVPVFIHNDYNGYSWADLPTIDKVEVTIGKTLYSKAVLCGTLTCVEDLVITAHTSDGHKFSSSVCMAMGPRPADAPVSTFDHVFVTPAARKRLSEERIWYHFGGPDEWEEIHPTQADQFDEELGRFWEDLVEED